MASTGWKKRVGFLAFAVGLFFLLPQLQKAQSKNVTLVLEIDSGAALSGFGCGYELDLMKDGEVFRHVEVRTPSQCETAPSRLETAVELPDGNYQAILHPIGDLMHGLEGRLDVQSSGRTVVRLATQS